VRGIDEYRLATPPEYEETRAFSPCPCGCEMPMFRGRELDVDRLSCLARNLRDAACAQRVWNLASDYYVLDDDEWLTWVPGIGMPTERYPMRRSKP
jgi:hypothetical protein